jgi:hypothetical protein
MTGGRAPFEALDDYVSGDMPDADVAGFEEELFAAAAAGRAAEAEFVDQFVQLGRHLTLRAGFDMGSTRARVDELIAAGLNVQILEPESAADGSHAFPPIREDAELVVTVIPFDVRGYDSLEVAIERPDGSPLKTFRDVSCDPETGYLYALCEAPLARLSVHRHVVARIFGKRGRDRHELLVMHNVGLASPGT